MPHTPPPAPDPRPSWSGWIVGFAAAAWLAGVAAGFAAWDAYDATPDPQAAAGPGEPSVAPWTLTLYAHPHCPCMRAGLAELAELTRALPAGVAVHVAFVRPAGAQPGWERTAGWDAAAAIPGVTVRCDAGGEDAARVGVTASGCAVLADATGRVAFRGGLTRGRGRAGESAARRTILGIVAGELMDGEAPVFGCPLANDPR
ncbi:RedB protein [bacterium]|nr:RedB protein [bacterium]